MCEILDVVLPGDFSRARFSRPAPAPLVVENQPMSFGKTQELRQQVIVVSARATVQDECFFSVFRTVGAPIQWNTCSRRVSGSRWGRDGIGHSTSGVRLRW